MWNHTDIPLGYLISFRTYGTWLHGDERGSTDRFHNAFRTPHIAPNEKWQKHNQRCLQSQPVLLDAAQRRSVENAIRETSDYRRWLLRAVSVRTNHVHVVISIGSAPPARALNTLKANATRQMREDGNWRRKHSPWSDKGSQKHLWNEQSVAQAMDYVLNGQGGDLKSD
ncbi:MAG: transposase [Pyrinomonadaceae bacterium]